MSQHRESQVLPTVRHVPIVRQGDQYHKGSSITSRGNPHRLVRLDAVRADIRLVDPVPLSPHATGDVVRAVRVTEARGIGEAVVKTAMLEAVVEMPGASRALMAVAGTACGER